MVSGGKLLPMLISDNRPIKHYYPYDFLFEWDGGGNLQANLQVQMENLFMTTTNISEGAIFINTE